MLLLLALFCVSLAVEVWHAAHYAAPAMGLFLLLVIEGLRHLRLWRWRGRRAGVVALWIVVLGCLVSPVRPQPGEVAGRGAARASIAARLDSSGAPALAIVRYSRAHDPGDEWVYNAADIGGSKVVWAREMDPASNRVLLAYFSSRRAWLVEPDARPPRVSPYDPSVPPDPPLRFVRLGPGPIEVLSDPPEIERRMRAWTARQPSSPDRLSCDQWNFVFTDVTGVEGPSADGCFPPGNPAQTFTLEQWFAWLMRQQ
jgi:hypothetical protein